MVPRFLNFRRARQPPFELEGANSSCESLKLSASLTIVRNGSVYLGPTREQKSKKGAENKKGKAGSKEKQKQGRKEYQGNEEGEGKQ